MHLFKQKYVLQKNSLSFQIHLNSKYKKIFKFAKRSWLKNIKMVIHYFLTINYF